MPIDYKHYPSNWKSEIRPSILERANNKCEWCGIPNNAIVHRYGKGKNDWVLYSNGMEAEAWSIDGKKSTKIVLTIAHIHNSDKKDCRPENLAALCQKCHLNHDIEHHKKNARETLIKKKKLQSLF